MKAFLQRRWELLAETFPAFGADLVLEAVENLVEHLLQVVFRVHPRGDCVAEEDEVVQHSGWVDGHLQTRTKKIHSRS